MFDLVLLFASPNQNKHWAIFFSLTVLLPPLSHCFRLRHGMNRTDQFGLKQNCQKGTIEKKQKYFFNFWEAGEVQKAAIFHLRSRGKVVVSPEPNEAGNKTH